VWHCVPGAAAATARWWTAVPAFAGVSSLAGSRRSRRHTCAILLWKRWTQAHPRAYGWHLHTGADVL